MAKKICLRKKLNDEKGVTGVDIVVSITMIIITISVVMAIFVNISNTARNVSRTSGATRMVTNILEQIEICYYEEFKDELVELTSKSAYVTYEDDTEDSVLYNGKYTIVGKNIPSTDKIFNTRIPNGYTLILEVSNVYGNIDTSKFDIVKKVTATVEYSVAGIKKEVSLTTTKQFEKLTSPNNEPVIAKENFAEVPDGYDSLEWVYLKEGTSNYAIDDSAKGEYGSTSVTPAMIISTKDKNGNSQLDSTKSYVNTSYINNIYIWIPAYNLKNGSLVYGYRNTDLKIKTVTLTDAKDSSNLMQLYTADVDTLESDYKLDDAAKGQEGLWVQVSELNQALNNTYPAYYYNFWSFVTSSLKN